MFLLDSSRGQVDGEESNRVSVRIENNEGSFFKCIVQKGDLLLWLEMQLIITVNNRIRVADRELLQMIEHCQAQRVCTI